MHFYTADEGWPLSDREYAFGWLVLGRRMKRETAARKAATAPIHLIERWARRQRQALAGFLNMLDGPDALDAWEDPVL